MPGTVGFIGLGAMGGPMALNLVKHGFALVAHDIDPAKRELWRTRGATVVDSAERVAASVERTICMVETTAQAEAVIAGEHGIVRSARPGHIVACMSTIDPFAARRLADQLAPRGIAMLDAPVSGGTERAASGELSIIVGGASETVAACKDLFEAMGKNVFHVGALGQGLAMKLVNNMLVQVTTVAIAEALVMGVKAGLDPQMIYELIRAGVGTSRVFEVRGPMMVKDKYENASMTIKLYHKDLSVIEDFAAGLGVPTPLFSASIPVYAKALAMGFGDLDTASVCAVLGKMAGVKRRKGGKRR